MIPATIKNETFKQKHLFLIDGYSFVFRAYHSLPPMTSPNGIPVNAVYGFTNMIMKLREKLREDDDHYMLVVFDAGGKTFRNDIYSEYKAHRPPAPEDLKPQFPLIREAVDALNIASSQLAGYEADDIIATYSKRADKEGMKVTIVSSDKDLMQLINENVEMFDSMRDRRIGSSEVSEKFGVNPDKVLDVLSLMGDSADNIPGVPGIGPKTAAELVNNFGSLEEVLANAESIKQKKRRENLIEFAEQARMSKELVTLCYETPVSERIDNFHLQPIKEDILVEFLNKYGFRSLLARARKIHNLDISHEDLYKVQEVRDEDPDVKTSIIKDKQGLVSWLGDLISLEQLSIYGYYEKNKLVAISLAKSKKNACYINLSVEKEADQKEFFEEEKLSDEDINIEDIIEVLEPYIDNKGCLKIAYNIKSKEKLLKSEITDFDDIMIMSYILDGSKNNKEIEDILTLHLGKVINKPDELSDKKISLSSIDEKKAADYLGSIAAGIISLQGHFRKRLLKEKMLSVYENLERKLVNVLNRMENQGIKVDVTILHDLSNDFSKRLSNLELEIFKIAEEEFNISSPKQLGEVLFENLGIPGGKKNKSGGYKTDIDVLEELSLQGHVIADHIIQWRSISKLKSTYTDALAKEINPKTGRIHTTFAMVSTSTGRLSSLSPNLQNIPIRTEDGIKIRNSFVAKKGYDFIGADYSQIELRLLAHMAGIDSLRDAFRHGLDIHSKTASQIFGVELDKVTDDLRRSAKTINFGIIYGQSAFGLASQLKISRGEAKEYIESYFMQYPGIRDFMEVSKQEARDNGYVKTLFGRKCFINGINAKGPLRAFAERAAINAPLQGTAADIIKRAMIQLDYELLKSDIDARILLQVHDELIIEANENITSEVQKMTKRVMENVISLSIPLIIDSKIGKNWKEVH